VIIGHNAFSQSQETGNYNTVIGDSALSLAAATNYTISIGASSGSTAGVAYCIYLGASAVGLNTTSQNEIVIGYQATGQGNNTVVLGHTTIIGTYLRGTVYHTASSTTRAGLNMPHGSAPSAPNNGDIWTATTGLWARINGTSINYAPLASPSFTGTINSAGTLNIDTISEYTPNHGIGFSKRILTTASTASYAGLNIPHGTAPTNPVNGDMWTTTAGLYIRINGATVGPLN
jgi:hypothetical protein